VSSQLFEGTYARRLLHQRLDGTGSGSDSEKALRAFFARLSIKAPDPLLQAGLLQMAAGADPSAAITALMKGAAEIGPTDKGRGSEELEPPDESDT
jgi:hypothetical protein